MALLHRDRADALRREARQSGVLRVELSLDTEGCLHDVTLPEEVPSGLTAEMLRQMMDDLGKLPLGRIAASSFTLSVWERLIAIPAGSALTYGEVAAQLGNPRAVRAVGRACGANRLLLVVPCHRVLAGTGLGGFRLGLAWKRTLLELESEFGANSPAAV